MGSSTSTLGGETEQKVFEAMRGTILRSGKRTSLLQDFLTIALPHAYGKDPRSRMSSLYVVRDGKEFERFGMLPSLQGSPDRFIVRPLRKEYIDSTDHFRKATDEVSNGVIAIYSVIASMLAITGMGLASHTKDYKDLVEEISKDSKSSTQSTQVSSGQNYSETIIQALRTYSSQKHTRNVSPRERNILFHMDNYPMIVPTMLKRIEDRIHKKYPASGSGGSAKGEVLLHTSILRAIDSFAICSRNPNSLKNVMSHLQKNGNLDVIVRTIQNLLSKDVVRAWLMTHPALKRRLQTITAGTARSARLIASNDAGFHEVIGEIMEEMRKHVENACMTNEMLSTYSSKRNVLVKSPKSEKYEYSKEANRMIVRIYQRFESMTRKMQSELLRVFMSVFDISKKEIPNSVNIKTTDGYVVIKPAIINSKEPGVTIMNAFLNIIEAYVKYIVNLQNTLRATINQKTRIL